jgi:hypothetical protein
MDIRSIDAILIQQGQLPFCSRALSTYTTFLSIFLVA